MMHSNNDYYIWGMHMGWWIFIVLAVVIVGWLVNSRRSK